MAYIFWISFILFAFIVVYSFFQRSKRSVANSHEDVNDKVIVLTDESFEEIIKKGVTLVDFWAPWCAPCRTQNPVIAQIAEEVGDVASICKINVDDHKKAAIRMKIKNIPNIIIFKDGEAVRQLIGLKPRHTILKALNSVINQ
jgi:thioredoxin 1